MGAEASGPSSGRSVSGEVRSEQLASEERDILERIARGAPPSELLQGIVRLVEQQSQDICCAVLIHDGARQTLRHGAALRLPRELCGAFDGLSVAALPAAGRPPAAHPERLSVEDIETQPRWANHKQPYIAHGLRACWSNPIASPAGELLGALEVYCAEKRGPSAEERAWLQAATRLASLALTRAEGERGNEQLVQKLGERVKELTLLHRITHLLQAQGREPRQQLGEVVGLIPAGWQHPEICEAHVVWGDEDVRTPGFRETAWKQVAHAGGVRVEVVYTCAPPGVSAPFLPEENNLLQSLSDLLGAHLQRYRAERALHDTLDELRGANQRLKFQARNMPLAYIVWDCELVVKEWNTAAERIFGWTAEEAIGRHAHELIVDAEAGSARTPLQAEILRSDASPGDAPQGGGSSRGRAVCAGGTHENVRKDGQRLVCEWFHAPLRDAGGAVVGHLSMANDVTPRTLAEEERNQLEAQLRQAQRIQSLGTLAGGIAHDFNNILTAIAGHAHLALTDLEEERCTKESLLAIQEAGLRAADVVRRLLTFSRQQAPRRQSAPLEPIAEQALGLLRATLPASIDFRCRFDGVAPNVDVDATQIQQVIMNLGANAAHAMAGRGTIDVSIATVCARDIDLPGIGDARAARYVQLSMSDTGAGMGSETLERIFEPFFTTKSSGQGTGLGLSVVHGIVRSHDGLLSVRSEPGQGSVFSVYLPEAASDSSSPAPPSSAAGGRLLYVDDEEPLVVLAQRWLSRLGYEVTGFVDSSLALASFRADPFAFDAVVSDFWMPGVSGLQLVREIRAIRPELPVVMSSGYLRPEDQRLAHLAGAGDVVLKPHSMAEFAQVLHRTLVSRRPSAELAVKG